MLLGCISFIVSTVSSTEVVIKVSKLIFVAKLRLLKTDRVNIKLECIPRKLSKISEFILMAKTLEKNIPIHLDE